MYLCACLVALGSGPPLLAGDEKDKVQQAETKYGLHVPTPMPIPGMAPGVGSAIIRLSQINQVLDNPEENKHMPTFEEAFDRAMAIEGYDRLHTVEGDPGGTTKWGISQRAFPNLNIAEMTRDKAKFLYRTQYWDRVKADKLPDALRGHVFDTAGNQGVNKAASLLQEAINLYSSTRGGPSVTVDGGIGPQTIAAANSYNPERLTTLFRHLRREDYINQAKAGQGKFLFGWLNRT